MFYRLDPKRPTERPGVFAGLLAYPGSEQVVQRVADGRPSTSAELEVLARNYPVDASGFDDPRRAHILRAFNKARKARVASQAARSVLEGAVKTADDGDRPMFRIALVVLGDRSQAASASRGLTGGIPDDETVVVSTGDLVAWGLHLAGCDHAGVARAYKGAHRLKDSARGPLCTR